MVYDSRNRNELGRVKRKRSFEYEQNAQIQII